MHGSADHRQKESASPARHREPFVMVPTALLLGDVSDRAVRVWAILDELARSSPSTSVAIDQLATVTGTNRRATSRALAELLKHGWLARVGGNGRASTYVPLRRPRPVARPVDNPDQDPGHIRPGLGADPGQIWPGSLADALITTRAKKAEAKTGRSDVDNGGGAARRPPWCGRCDQHTRLVEAGDRVDRCPSCHPLTVPPF